MNKKAQAGMEYLMTYGWALILVVTVIGVLVFIVSTPVDDVVFRSSDPTKLMLKGASVLAGAAQIKLQNITGGKITITALTSDNYLGLKINGQDPPLEIGAGGELVLEGTGTTGTITVEYTDYSGIGRTTTITGGGGAEDMAFNPGTSENPYDISDCTELQAINDGDMGAYYQLTQSFSCSGIANFDPIGDTTTKFTGHFDGQGFTISGLKINRPGEIRVGLFGYADSGSSISNVGLTGVNILGYWDVGGLAGANYGDITNSYTTGTVTGTNNDIGGLVGFAGAGSISDSYSTSTVTGDFDCGGLIGRNYGSSVVTKSYATGTVNGDGADTGGLVGLLDGGSVSDSYASGTVISTVSNVGGLVGRNQGRSITNSYATGNVTGVLGYTGGLVGGNWLTGSVTNSYATGTVTSGGYYIGGLIGQNITGVITNGYWFNSQINCYKNGNNGCPTAGPEASASVFFDTDHDVYDTGAPNWDFGSVWNDTGSYPTLK